MIHEKAEKQKRACVYLLIMVMLAFLSGCGKGRSGVFGKADLPEDTPWNHGLTAIMETEHGYYSTGIGEEMCLRYYEKGSGDTIVLCNKPECEHGGDDQCEATYRNLSVVNACLYEGYIYLLGYEGLSEEEDETALSDPGDVNTISFSLYGAALDGSAIDKVGTVFETDNVQNQSVNPFRRVAGDINYENPDSSFIIHKGVAYIPLYLQLGEGSAGLRGAGLYRMDLSTGATKEIEKYETLQSRAPAYLFGVSDYVYYYRFDYATRKTFWYRYVISENVTEAADPMFGESVDKNVIFGKKFSVVSEIPFFTANRSYWLVRTYQEKEDGVLSILAVDAKTQEIIPEESFETQIPYDKRMCRINPRQNGYYTMTHYDGKFVIANTENVYIYDEKGNKAGEVAVPKEELNWNDAEKNIKLDFKINNGTLYLIYGNNTDTAGLGGINGYYPVMSCPLKDICQGQGKWTYAYRKYGLITFKEYLLERMEKNLQKVSEEYREALREKDLNELRCLYPEEFKDK